MNIYIRFFDKEVLATSLNDAFAFLQSIPDIDVDEFLMRDIEQFVNSSVMYPKRYKVSARAYFIIIKTHAETLEEFKAIGAGTMDSSLSISKGLLKPKNTSYGEPNAGWYDGEIVFKRVVAIPGTQKFQYMDTEFKARLWAESVMDCYSRVVSYLRTRQDVDPRSQFPSVKGKNFICTYLGNKR